MSKCHIVGNHMSLFIAFNFSFFHLRFWNIIIGFCQSLAFDLTTLEVQGLVLFRDL